MGCQSDRPRALGGRRTDAAGAPRRPTDTPGEYRRSGIALRGPPGRCYHAPAHGAGTPAGRPRGDLSGAARRRLPQPAGCADPRVPSTAPRPRPGATAPHPAPQHRSRQGPHGREAHLARGARRAPGRRCLRPTSRPGCATRTLVDVDDNRFRIAVPNGFAKDWLETRYRSLISQTLARIVGYSVQVEFVVRRATPRGGDGPADGRRRPARASRSASSRRGSAARAARPASTRATRSRTSSSARPTGSPMRPPCRSPSARATPTTRSSSTAGWASARPT